MCQAILQEADAHRKTEARAVSIAISIFLRVFARRVAAQRATQARQSSPDSERVSFCARMRHTDAIPAHTTLQEEIMKRKASAVWQGGLRDGKGALTTDSGVLSNTQYSFSTRFEEGIGTNPEELIAAAHAGCFSMALSGQLGNAGLTAESITTTATVTMEKTDAGFTITESHLDVTARVPGASQEAFETAANNAKAGCPISRLLNARITMTATLAS
jgi:osmotically inducible protein OsmC